MSSWRAASGFLRVFCVVSIFILPLSSTAQILTTPVRTVGGVVDYATILTPQEKSELEVAAGQLARRIDTDFFIVTVDDRAGQWAQQRSHYAMVGRVFSDVGAAVEKHFGRPAPLTVLIVFKSSVVLHLKTNREDIEDYLFFHSFYAGAKDALHRIRQPGERHASAAMRYLLDFDATLSAAGGTDAPNDLEAKSRGVDLWMFQEWAVLKSRQFAQIEFLEPLYKFYCAAIAGAATHLFLPGWMGFLLLIAISSAFFKSLTMLTESRFGIGSKVFDVAALPHLTLLYAVAQADLENLLYISQNFGGDLVTYLDWSSDIAAHAVNIPIEIFALSACTVAGVELYVRLGKYPTETSSNNDPMGTRLRLMARKAIVAGLAIIETAAKVGWVVTLVIWPSLIAAGFLLVALGLAFYELYQAVVKDRNPPKPEPVAAAYNIAIFQRGGAS